MTRRRFLILTGGVLIVGAGALATGARRSFRARIDGERDALLAAAGPIFAGTIDEAHLSHLPVPVQRWMRASGVVGTAIPSVVRLTQRGEFRLGAGKPWMPFRATEYYTTNPPGFLWDVSMHMYPPIQISGRDSYHQETGDIEMRIASLIPVAGKSGGNLNSGALLRYLNETMWFPGALLLPNVTWEDIDDTSARATLTDAGRAVSAVFQFDSQDRLANMTANRWNDAEQAVLPWSTPITDWGTFAGITIATAGTGIWRTGPDAYEYVRLRVTNLEYDPARPWVA